MSLLRRATILAAGLVATIIFGEASAQPKPEFYGTYIVSDGKLIELVSEGVGCFINCSLRGKKSKTVVQSGKNLSFIIYNKIVPLMGLSTARVEIVGNIRRIVVIDPHNGSRKVENVDQEMLTTDGYDFRVRPIPNNSEMIEIKNPDPNFILPPGRYVLHIGQSYQDNPDFSVAGEIPSDAPNSCLIKILKQEMLTLPATATYERCSLEQLRASATASLPAICRMVDQSKLEAIINRRVLSAHYSEPRAGGKICVYSLALRPGEIGIQGVELAVRHLVHEDASSASRFARDGLPCSDKDGNIVPLEISSGEAYTCRTFANGERNDGLSITLARGMRGLGIYYQFFGAPGGRPASIANFSKPLVTPTVALGSLILDRWDVVPPATNVTPSTSKESTSGSMPPITETTDNQGKERAATAGSSAGRIGPSFDCYSATVTNQPLAQLICSSDELARADLAYVIAYQAVLHGLIEQQRKAFFGEANAFVELVTRECGIPKAGRFTRRATADEIECLRSRYVAQRDGLLRRLRGGALDEARLAPEEAMAIQLGLKSRGFLSEKASVDGVFGPMTRAAIESWQKAIGQEATGFASKSMLSQLSSQERGTDGKSQVAASLGALPPPRPDEQCLAYIERVRPELGISAQGTAADFVKNVQAGRFPRLKFYKLGIGNVFVDPNSTGTASTTAQTGDILAFGTGKGIGPEGHVAIITGVSDFSITVLQANFDASAPDGSYTFTIGGPKNGDGQIVGIIRPVK
jgi:peptidoglycan hydrolase-like protein with peptidoglycan-binding domain